MECCNYKRCCGERRAAAESLHYVACDGGGAVAIGDLLRALRGRTLAMVGDSTMDQLWTALVDSLYQRPMEASANASAIEARPALYMTQRVLEYDVAPRNLNADAMCTVSHTSPPRLGGSENHYRLDPRLPTPCRLVQHGGGQSAFWPLRTMCGALPDNEMWLEAERVRFLFYRLDSNASKSVRAAWQRSHGPCGSARHNFDAKVEAAIASADVVVANLGVWYAREQTADYRRDVRYLLRTLRRASEQSGGRQLTLFREATPQHFPTATGSGTYEDRLDARKAARGATAAGWGASARSGCQRTCSALGPSHAHVHDW